MSYIISWINTVKINKYLQLKNLSNTPEAESYSLAYKPVGTINKLSDTLHYWLGIEGRV